MRERSEGDLKGSEGAYAVRIPGAVALDAGAGLGSIASSADCGQLSKVVDASFHSIRVAKPPVK